MGTIVKKSVKKVGRPALPRPKHRLWIGLNDAEYADIQRAATLGGRTLGREIWFRCFPPTLKTTK